MVFTDLCNITQILQIKRDCISSFQNVVGKKNGLIRGLGGINGLTILPLYVE